MSGVAKVTFNGQTLIDVTDKTVTAAKMLNTGTALDKAGDSITGSIASKSSSDLTVSGATVTAPAGYYSSSASKSVASGSAGTPTASKSSVSNHSISVTPSVTNTTGYITGSTKTGTAVTVSASELVSGNKSITSNGTGIDVANYSTVSVSVPTGTINNQDKTVDPSTAQQAVTADSGYTGLGTVTVNAMPTMTLPTAPTTTYTGTKIGSNIGRSTSTRYINIPVGYNDTAKYYQISAVSNMTLPTATSTSATGTSKLTIAPGASTKYLNIPIGYNGTASYYTISPGMTFETGTWTPAEDIARGTIPFASTHSSMPLYVCIFDQTQTTHETGSPSYMLYMDEYQIFGATFPSNTNFRYGCITSLFKTDSGTNVYVGTLQYPSTETGNSSTAYPRYWVTESGFYPYSGSTARYWRAGRTYKWLAVWK